MKIGTKVEFEDTRDYDFYTCIVTFNSQEAKESLSEHLVNIRGYQAEFCSSGEDHEVFSSPKDGWYDKKEFMKEMREEIKYWKNRNRG